MSTLNSRIKILIFFSRCEISNRVNPYWQILENSSRKYSKNSNFPGHELDFITGKLIQTRIRLCDALEFVEHYFTSKCFILDEFSRNAASVMPSKFGSNSKTDDSMSFPAARSLRIVGYDSSAQH